MTEENMENQQDILALNLKQQDLEDLMPEVRQIYQRRVKMQLMTTVSIFDYVDVMTANF